MSKNGKFPYPGIPTTSDGGSHVVWVESHITQASCAYPITSSTIMGVGYQAEVANGKKNLWGETLMFIEPESEHSSASSAEGFAASGGRVTNFTSGQGLVLMKEVLYTISGKRLPVVFKASVILHQFVEGMLACMAKRRMPQIMGQRHGVGTVLVGSQILGNASGYLRHLQRMGQPRSVVVPFVIGEYLGLVFQPSKCIGMDDSIAITLKRSPVGAFVLRMRPSLAVLGCSGRGCHGAAPCRVEALRNRPQQDGAG